jgi:hypothetical protein
VLANRIASEVEVNSLFDFMGFVSWFYSGFILVFLGSLGSGGADLNEEFGCGEWLGTAEGYGDGLYMIDRAGNRFGDAGVLSPRFRSQQGGSPHRVGMSGIVAAGVGELAGGLVELAGDGGDGCTAVRNEREGELFAIGQAVAVGIGAFTDNGDVGFAREVGVDPVLLGGGGDGVFE